MEYIKDTAKIPIRAYASKLESIYFDYVSYSSSACHPYFDLIFDFPSKVLNDKGRLHDWCGDKVFVSLMLLLEFG